MLVIGAVVDDIVECFEPYRPDGWTVDRALDNLDAKLAVDDFTGDLDQLVNVAPNGYSVDADAQPSRSPIRSDGESDDGDERGRLAEYLEVLVEILTWARRHDEAWDAAAAGCTARR